MWVREIYVKAINIAAGTDTTTPIIKKRYKISYTLSE